MNYCPICKADFIAKTIDDFERLLCSSDDCDFVYWNNPTPVVAAVVEHNGEIILANNYAWPEHVYSLITGFLEKGESSEQGVIREVKEELGLKNEHIELIEIYPFFRMNQIILGYYVRASGTVELNEELRSYKHIKKGDLHHSDSATGYILRDWLHSQGFHPKEVSLFKPAPKKTKRGALYERIDNMVKRIPEGQLATYGQIAKLVGSCGARQVGYAMAALDDDCDVPWYRVINSQGRISARSVSEGHTVQRYILEEEGIVFSEKGKINLEIYRWPGPDSE
jgi:alkylated DNA nucleotide flippase Atl1/8-oxo-dGTP pyrophosphatase MutT (NUDIX family)